MKMQKIHKQIMEILRENPPLTLDEISQKLDVPKKKVFKALRKLFQEEIIRTEKIKYYTLSDEAEKE